MASLRSKFYSAILRRFLRGSILPEGEEGVRMMRERMASGSVLGPIMRTRAQKHSVTINGMGTQAPATRCSIYMAAAI
jgi:hypothetical protein